MRQISTTAALVLGCALLVMAVACGPDDRGVSVTFRDGRLLVEPSTVAPGHLVFTVNNAEALDQRFAVVELLGLDGKSAPAQTWDPAALPVENGQVRDYTYVDEPSIAVRTANGGYSQGTARGLAPPRPRPEDLGVLVPAGATRKVEISYEAEHAGKVLVLFSDLPGRYESGQWAVVTVK